MKLLWALLFAGGLLFLICLDLYMPVSHGDFPWSNIPAFFTVFGLVSCLIIILASKWLGHHWLQKKEDYYERNDGDD